MARWTTKAAGLGILGGRTLLILAAIIMASAALMRWDYRLDWSANATFTIDPVLAEIIDELPQATRIIGIWPRQSSHNEGRYQAAIGDLIEPRLKAMARRSPDLTWTHVDNELDLPLLEELRKQYPGLGGPAIYLVTQAGDAAQQRPPFRIPLNGLLATHIQREVGGALRTVHAETITPILVIQGHGELRPEGGMDNGANTLLRNWALAGFEAMPFDQQTLDNWGRLPASAIVAILGPTTAVGGPMRQAIAQHLRDGGPLLLLADHRLDPQLAKVFQERGILIGPRHPPTMGFDPLSALQAESPHAAHLIYSEPHSTGRDGSFHRLLLRPETAMVDDPFGVLAATKSSGRLLNSTASVAVNVLDPRRWPAQQKALSEALAGQGIAGMTASPLLVLPADEAWMGPVVARQTPPSTINNESALPLAWAVNYAADEGSASEHSGARVVIWGSRQAASDAILSGDSYANGQLLTDMLSWLANRGAQVPIPPAGLKPFRVDAEASTLNILLGLLVAVIPCLFLGGAMIAWWERR